MFYRLLAFLLFVSAGIDGHGQVKEYPFARLVDQDGLANNGVHLIHKDRHGFLWIGTAAGLCRYDGYGFKVFRHDDLDTFAISDEEVLGITEAPDDKLLIITSSGVINILDALSGRYLPKTNSYFDSLNIPRFGLVNIVRDSKKNYFFVFADSGIYRLDSGARTGARHLEIRRDRLEKAPIAAAGMDGSGHLWLTHLDGVVERIDPARGAVTLHSGIPPINGLQPPRGYQFYIDRRDRVWLYGADVQTGLWEFDPRTADLRHFCRDSGAVRLNTDNVESVVQDERGMLWVATDQGGVNILDSTLNSIRYLQHTLDERSIPENTVTALCTDDMGGVWLGTLKNGLCHYQPNMLRFPVYKTQLGAKAGLPYEDINCFAEDARGNLWIGTDGGGLIYFDRTAGRFVQYRHRAGDGNSLSTDVVVSLMVDRRDRVWIGTYQGGLDCYDGRRFVHFRHNPADSFSLADDRVFSLLEAESGDIWVGTLDAGLDRLETSTHKFDHTSAYFPNSIHSNYVASLANDSAHNLWVGTAYGISVLSASTGRYVYYTEQTGKLADNVVFGLSCDHQGNMWVATRRGLCVMQPGRDTFQVFHVRDGLPSNHISNVLESNDHFLWVTTSAGLSRVSVTQDGAKLKISCLNFDEGDGLQARLFNRGAALRTKEGEIALGGRKGFNLFRPESITLDEHIPAVILTGIQLANNEIGIPPGLARDGELVLRHDQNNFTLEFVALDYINARKNKYAYRLLGFDKDWMNTDGRNHRAAYTNIDPGVYTFQIKASNSDGLWNEKGVTFKIIVRPPFWKTTVAYVLYVLLALGLLYGARSLVIRRARSRFALEEERRDHSRLQDLDRMKTKFFTNLSQEFRAPLTLILSPIGKIIRTTNEPATSVLATTVERNALRLQHLVNQLLDHRKMESNELKLNVGRGDIAAFIKASADSFADLAAGRGIAYSYETEIEHLDAFFDKDKVERILFNLLSNAFKFTPAGGSVRVELSMAESDAQNALLELEVVDSGIGIPAAIQERIFDSFFQGRTTAAEPGPGIGIGLAITREFVELHGGTIGVDSAPDKGSRFTVLLPVSILPDAPDNGSLSSVPDTEAVPQSVAAAGRNVAAGQRRHKVLLVEDDEDFRFYLRENLARLFTVLEAADGSEGWQKAVSDRPDLVVTDIQLPSMDGLELAKKIRGDARLGHVPVIFLTATSADEDLLTNTEAQRNDFIPKPFNVEILISRIRNLIGGAGKEDEPSKRRNVGEPAEIEADPAPTDEDFIRKAVAALEREIANADFSVEDWSREMGLSRTNLYKRIVAATGKTPIGFIRNFRMKRAAQLLEKTRHSVAEVAYMVGFNNPKYFARYFREEFGILPSVYQAEMRKKGRN